MKERVTEKQIEECRRLLKFFQDRRKDIGCVCVQGNRPGLRVWACPLFKRVISKIKTIYGQIRHREAA